LVNYTAERVATTRGLAAPNNDRAVPMRTYLLLIGVAISLTVCAEGQMPPVAGYNFNPVIVRKVQNALRDRGYYRGFEDGYLGEDTGIAIQMYQIDHRTQVIPLLGPSLLLSLGIAR
jgi:hypothetical protein